MLQPVFCFTSVEPSLLWVQYLNCHRGNSQRKSSPAPSSATHSPSTAPGAPIYSPAPSTAPATADRRDSRGGGFSRVSPDGISSDITFGFSGSSQAAPLWLFSLFAHQMWPLAMSRRRLLRVCHLLAVVERASLITS